MTTVNTIILKNSSVTGKEPLTSDLQYGELALNYTDGKLYFKNSSNTIDAFTVGGGGGGASEAFRTIAVTGQTSVVADSSTDTLSLVAGKGITLTTDSTADSVTITNSDAVTFDVDSRITTVTTKLSAVMQNYLTCDQFLTRTSISLVETRTGLYAVTG